MPAAKKSTTTKKADETPIVDETVAVEKTAPPVKSAPKQKELSPSDEVEVASNVPYRVSYEDKATADKYVWESVGEVQYMTIETLTRMRRNFPSYFEKMEVMPTDERVIDKLNLSKLCDKTEEFMSVDAYTRECVGATCEKIKALGSGAKLTVLQKIKGMIESGDIIDIAVIRTIEKRLGVDLVSVL